MRGLVQGVGFRPFVHREATARGLAGWVRNSAEGVVLEAEGERSSLENLLDALERAAPAHAAVANLDVSEIAARGEAGFTILPSDAEGARKTLPAPDYATCPDCLEELFDASNRRYLYPFINCTQCGPRFSIIEDLPYDRARTSMRRFAMCAQCQREYDDPQDRRFHAEPNACPVCGPQLALWNTASETLAMDRDALLAATEALRAGAIVAVKGIGGFHLMVDARSQRAVTRLRARKRRPEKPFAVMFPTLATLHEACRISAEEEALLTSPASPIVLLKRSSDTLASAVAPENPLLGAMLPYSPLHHLLMRELGFPIVATSGNISDEPIVIDEHDVLARLTGVADIFLVHNRPIVRPLDDSVTRVVCGHELMLRRARGYAPASITVADAMAGVLALGGHLKTSIALTGEGAVTLGPHIGDLESVETREAHARAAQDLIRLGGARPQLIVRDLHPDYATSRTAEDYGKPIFAVQHHLAHVVACMAENGVSPPALGVAWDGAGYGLDGTIWGGEFLLVTKSGWRRVAHLRSFPLPGGDAAAREPRRAALGLLYEAFGSGALAMADLVPLAAFTPNERDALGVMLARGVNSPLTSSAGRLFDAFAALCGLRQRASYEGQAASQLEWALTDCADGPAYPFPLRAPEKAGGAYIMDWAEALHVALSELRGGAAPGAISDALHNGLANAIVALAERIGERRVALSGGCFQNTRLLGTAVGALRAAGFEPLWHRRVPPNDGGLALGQAAWAAWREAEERETCV
ncbi:MAG: carbamoyltransferase HypF [Alphaproteobacteria bacterium]|nr:carbamoyltransferase HypF [Alphaproteobacteria bacterium]